MCPICKSVLDRNGFCKDPECLIDVNNTCKCLKLISKENVKVIRRLVSA
jgi:hypothetical protein